MITGFYCTNVFSEHAKELIDFYREVLEIPVIKTDADDSNGVYFGFIENAPTLCIWDCKVFDAQPTGYQSFVFQTDNLELTMESLKKKGVALSEAEMCIRDRCKWESGTEPYGSCRIWRV